MRHIDHIKFNVNCQTKRIYTNITVCWGWCISICLFYSFVNPYGYPCRAAFACICGWECYVNIAHLTVYRIVGVERHPLLQYIRHTPPQPYTDHLRKISFDNWLCLFVSCGVVRRAFALLHVLFQEQLQLKATEKWKKVSFFVAKFSGRKLFRCLLTKIKEIRRFYRFTIAKDCNVKEINKDKSFNWKIPSTERIFNNVKVSIKSKTNEHFYGFHIKNGSFCCSPWVNIDIVRCVLTELFLAWFVVFLPMIR